MATAEIERITGICKSLHPRNPARKMAEAALTAPDEIIVNLEPFLRLVNDMPWRTSRERELISWLACTANWTEDQCARISETLSNLFLHGINGRGYGKFATKVFILGVLVYPLLIIASDSIIPTDSDRMSAMVFFVVYGLCAYLAVRGIGTFVTRTVSGWFDSGTREQYGTCVELLGRVGLPGCIGALANAYIRKPLREIGAIALQQAAARLQPSDYGTLPPRTVPELCSALVDADSETALVILHALAIIGDGSAIRPVKRLLSQKSSASLHEAAHNLLPILRERELQSRTHSMLLRPSGQQPDAAQTFLRAACEPSKTNAVELLRHHVSL